MTASLVRLHTNLWADGTKGAFEDSNKICIEKGFFDRLGILGKVVGYDQDISDQIGTRKKTISIFYGPFF